MGVFGQIRKVEVGWAFLVIRAQEEQHTVDFLDRPDEVLFEGPGQVAGILDGRFLRSLSLGGQMEGGAQPNNPNHRHPEKGGDVPYRTPRGCARFVSDFQRISPFLRNYYDGAIIALLAPGKFLQLG